MDDTVPKKRGRPKKQTTENTSANESPSLAIRNSERPPELQVRPVKLDIYLADQVRFAQMCAVTKMKSRDVFRSLLDRTDGAEVIPGEATEPRTQIMPYLYVVDITRFRAEVELRHAQQADLFRLMVSP